MEHCPICSQPLVPFRAKLICRTPGCGFMENCCDGGWMLRNSKPSCTKPSGAVLRATDPSADSTLSAAPARD